jgi:hypothetical protein
MLTIGQEWPLGWLRTHKRLSDFERELIHLRRFSTDQAVTSGGMHAFADIQPGANPPDATVLTREGRIGVECTALAIQDRREAHNLFLQLRRRLQTAEPTAFANLAGHMIYVWFRESASPGPPARPHRRSNTRALDQLVQALAEYEPASQALLQADGTVPETLPALSLADTSFGATFYALPLLGGVPGSMLFTLAGFDIGLVYSTMLTSSAAWDEVQRRVDHHDQPSVDCLLVTAGGPDADGVIFPAEEPVAAFLLDHARGLSHPPEHIKRVILHSWATGRATLLYPELVPLFGPLYASMTPVHHSLAVTARPADQ